MATDRARAIKREREVVAIRERLDAIEARQERIEALLVRLLGADDSAGEGADKAPRRRGKQEAKANDE